MAIKIKGRNENRLNTRKKVLIVCEGAKTEPNYFKGFRVAKDVCDVKGFGANTVSLVRKAEELSQQGDYREVWCVFDRDSFTKKRVTEALNLAKQLGFKCAFSNESFELWYVLHFCYLDTQITRHDYCEKLNGFLKSSYQKNDPFMHDLLTNRQKTAIQNAETLEKAMRKPGLSMYDMRPITTVHHLVKRLNKIAKEHGK